MAASTKLKVFRTPIGFHDAYVAAVSQKAALEAWGSDSNLFAQKSAEQVTDPELMAEPLAKPGVVIKRLRGTEAEQIAALPPDVVRVPKAAPTALSDEKVPRSAHPEKKTPEKLRPRPDRSALTAIENAREDAKSAQAVEAKVLRDRQAALERERREMERAHRRQIEALEESLAREEAAYGTAIKRWQG